MADRNLVHLRLKTEGSKAQVRALLREYNLKGESNTLTSALSKVVDDWIKAGRIPVKYRRQ